MSSNQKRDGWRAVRRLRYRTWYPAEQLPNVFAQFWQASKGDKRGIGLGLAIAKGIVEAHTGKI